MTKTKLSKNARLTSFLRRALSPQWPALLAGPGRVKQLCAAAVATGVLAAGGDTFAQGSFQWNNLTNVWETPGNWTPLGGGASPPDSAGEDALFGAGGPVNPEITSFINIDGITFQAGAPSYTITVGPGGVGGDLFLVGYGIVNSSGVTQTIQNDGTLSFVVFDNSAVAQGVTINNAGTDSVIRFFTNSSAGTSTINNNSDSGLIDFLDATTAGTAIINNSADFLSGAGGVIFSGTASAADSTITNIVADSRTTFTTFATLGNGHIINQGDFSNTLFNLDSNAGTTLATIDNVGDGSYTQFENQASAGSATINNTAFTFVDFFNNSSAGNSTINNIGSGFVEFFDSASAANSTINNSSPLATVTFADTSTAGNATINNSGGGPSPALSSLVAFFSSSSAGNSNIVNSASNTRTSFNQTSTAGSAFIMNSGTDSSTVFQSSSTAGFSTITNSGSGSSTVFFDSSSGGSAALVNANPTASIDISSLVTPGTTAGSIAGNGALYLGSKNLAVGLNNTSTTFSGIIQDGGLGSGVGGSLTKVGTGTLALSGANTYTGGTVISAGVLQLSDGGTTGSIVGNVENNAVLAFSRSNELTFGGVISGSGAVRQIGSGTTILTGANTYTGGTSISAGVLQLGNGGTTGSIVGDVENNAVLAFNQSNELTFDGVISGSGVVRQIGSGTTILTGVNTYTGGTSITAGVLQLGNGGTTGSIVGDVENNAVLAFNRSNELTVDGVISGSGVVRQIGSGTTILTGANTYTGGTSITAGVLQLGNGGTTGSIVGNVANDAVLAFNRSNIYTFNGIISGTGAVEQNGTGKVILTAANTYTGDTTVNQGQLIVDGSIASANTFVNAAGLLGGMGVVGGNVLNRGTVEPGYTPHGLTVNGNYTQTSDGNLRIQIASNSEFGKLKVGGVANLAGRVTAVGVDGFSPEKGDTFTFLTAAGGVSGEFEELNSTFGTSTILKFGLIYDSNSVTLEAQQGSFADFADAFGFSSNQKAVARALDEVAFDPRASRLIEYLNQRSLDDLPGDFDRIAPDEIAAVFDISLGLANVQSMNLQRRMDAIRSGSTGFSSADLAMNGSGPGYSGPAHVQTGAAGPAGNESKESKTYEVPEENKLGVFLSGVGEWIDVDGDGNARGYEISTGGFTVGIDYKVNPNFAVGLSAGYAGTGADLVGDGRVFVNGGKLGLYATYFTGGFYVDAAANGGYNSYDTKRSALEGTARGETEGLEFNALLGTGYDFTAGNWRFGPTATVQYTKVAVDEFRERGSLAPLQIEEQDADSLRTAVGFRTSYNIQLRNGVVIRPEVRAAWQHEFADRRFALDSRFASGAGSVFSVYGPEYGRDSLLLSAGVTVVLNERTALFLHYDGQLARENYDSHSVSGGVRITY